MGWPSTDFTSRSYALAGDLAALCLAVNEREAALDITETVFTIQDGTTTARPTAAELSGFVLGDNGDTDKFRDTIIEVQVAAKALVDLSARQQFVTADQSNTLWTHANLISDIGITDKTSSEDFSTTFDWNDSNVWERLRQYLDALIYVIAGPVLNNGTTKVRGISNVGSLQDNWDLVKADSVSTVTNTPAQPKITWETSVTGAVIRDNAVLKYATDNYSGTETATNFAASWVRYDLAINVTFKVESEQKTLTTGGTTSFEFTSQTASIGSVSNFDVAFVTAEPATHPFVGVPGFHSISLFRSTYTTPAGWTNSGLKVWIDLTSVLTDQA